MMQVAASNSADLERAELETVLAALARTPRLAKLLSYVAEGYFAGRTEEITEYNIATEVFGRSKTAFDSSQDSIARVEAYRLRKRLKEYYQTEGKDHDIQIALPSGSYVPAFIRCASSAPVASTPEQQVVEDELEKLSSVLAQEPEATPDSAGTHIVETDQPGSRVRPDKSLYRLAAIAALLLLTFGAVWFLWRHRSTNQPKAGASQPLNPNQPTPKNAAQVPLRLLAGYEGSPRIDSAGAYWQADRYFSGEAGFTRPDAPVARTSDPMLFEHWRTGNFSYDIPLPPGPYELHLFFVALPPEDFRTQFFDVSANGQPLLKAFNISADALGANIADEKVFKDIYPDEDGFLHLKFVTDRSTPSLNAIEILPGLPHRQLPVRLVMQAAAVTDHNGNLWHPDNYFENGAVSDPPRQVSGTPDPALYAQERYGHFTYSIPVDTRGRYTLVLHFAELYWVPDASGSVGVGSRKFNVYCNGSTLLDNFDIFKEVGSLHALTKTFHHLRPSPEGKLDLTFDPIVNYATVSAIEVIDESE
jgi:hypothetical protein